MSVHLLPGEYDLAITTIIFDKDWGYIRFYSKVLASSNPVLMPGDETKFTMRQENPKTPMYIQELGQANLILANYFNDKSNPLPQEGAIVHMILRDVGGKSEAKFSRSFLCVESKDTKYPHKCPRCGGPAYIGAYDIDCRTQCY